MRELVENETRNTIEYLANVPDSAITEKMYPLWTSGGDGSGRHSIYRSCKTDAGDTYNIILGGMRLISIKNDKGELVYEEKCLGN